MLFIQPSTSSAASMRARKIHWMPKSIESSLESVTKAYLGGHYLSLHITVVSVVLAAAGVAAASLITRPMGADHQLLVLWLLWIGSLTATAGAYGGPMVGNLRCPPQCPPSAICCFRFLWESWSSSCSRY